MTLAADEYGHAQFSMGEDNITLDTAQFSAIQEAWLGGADALSDTLFVKFDDDSPAGNIAVGLAANMGL